MSTKCTIAHRSYTKDTPGFHFYSELFDTENAWLDLHGNMSFDVSNMFVQVAIPVAIMDAIAAAWVASGRASVLGQKDPLDGIASLADPKP